MAGHWPAFFGPYALDPFTIVILRWLQSPKDYLWLRERGHTVRKTIDCIVATFCLEAGHELLHRDRDFDAFEGLLGLRVLHP